MIIEPDTKDWTWVLERPCHECGFDANGVRPVEQLPDLIRENAHGWSDVLADEDVAVRPAPHGVVAAGVRLPRARRAPHLRLDGSG